MYFTKSLFICAVILLFSFGTDALIHNLHIRDDTRGSFFIENFGFEGEGHIIMNFSNIKVTHTLNV
jgi:hypothetical protein